MNKSKLHIAGCDKFMPPFVKVVEAHCNFQEHEFLLSPGPSADELDSSQNIILSKNKRSAGLNFYLKAFIKMHKAKKIYLHGLFDIRMVLLLFLSPWLLKKCHWIIWGGDLYTYKNSDRNLRYFMKEILRRPVIKNMGFLVTYIKGDVELARLWYGAKGQLIECIMYPSNLYKDLLVPKNESDVVNIQVGNSADVSNNHIEVLEKLLPYKEDNINIYVPLSYGSQDYADKVITVGKMWFGDKFKPLTTMLKFEEYMSFLASIDIAIFNNNRQQALGNIITLLGLGKTVFIRSDTTHWVFFKERGVEVKDIARFEGLEYKVQEKNVEKIKFYFSHENYLKQLNKLFG